MKAWKRRHLISISGIPWIRIKLSKKIQICQEKKGRNRKARGVNKLNSQKKKKDYFIYYSRMDFSPHPTLKESLKQKKRKINPKKTFCLSIVSLFVSFVREEHTHCKDLQECDFVVWVWEWIGMVKRLDFAQKLLDDLGLRKERLASSSQSSNRSNSSTPNYWSVICMANQN